MAMRTLLVALLLLLLVLPARIEAAASPSAVNLKRSDVPPDFRPVDLHDTAQPYLL